MGLFDVAFILFITDHSEHLRRGVVDTFDTAVSTRVVGGGREGF